MGELLFCCPLCGGALTRQEHRAVCPQGHSFDVARQGYVHLLPVNKMHSKLPGDSREMVEGRRRFLEAGYYAPFRQELCRLAAACASQLGSPAGEGLLLCDAGCGEGYYTAGIYQALRAAGKQPRMAGIDISKFILRSAAKRERGIEFAVASAYHLPLPDASVDALLNCFSPLALTEFHRVLKPGGYFLYVVPGAEHLWEMKEILYDRPYPNEERETPYEGFSYEAIVPVDETITLRSREDIQNLFRMTPYAWKTPREGKDRLAERETLTTRISFRVHIFRRDEDR